MREIASLRKSIAAIVAGLASCAVLQPVYANQSAPATATPIKHLVVIFQENISFDHYFATYPVAKNPAGEPEFHALPGTPTVNGLTGLLLTNNPNATSPANSTPNLKVNAAFNPFRLDRSEASTNDQDHDYTPEQEAFDFGLMDAFPASVGTAGPPPAGGPPASTQALTMGYFDGNTVTAYWNYAQRYALNDNSYGTNFGPSTDGAINLISGQTNGVIDDMNSGGSTISDGNGGLTLISDADPNGDVCSTTTGETLSFSGKNVGDLLSAANVTWGFFEGGFDLTRVNANKSTGCNRSTTSTVTNTLKADYIPHHEPFQYYASTANLKHTRPKELNTIGTNADPANHQYDIHDFFDAVTAGTFPAVSYLKAPGFQDGHAGYSDPLDEQNFVVTVINFLQQQPDWSSTAVIIAYDDSDGWYDHVAGPIVNQSATAADQNAKGTAMCGTGTAALPGVNPATTHAQGRCGFGPRLPLLVISPWARQNFVDHTLTDQSSILRFVEDNWLGGKRLGAGSFDTITNSLNNMFDFNARSPENTGRLFLNVSTGEVEGSN
jgi:phospholipase C